MRRVKRALPLVAAVLALGVPLSGCGNESGARGGDDVSAGASSGVGSGRQGEQEMDMQEAAERADAMLDAVLKGIDPDVRWAHGPTTTRACGVTRRRAVMTVVSPERRQTFLDRAETFWRKNDYRIKAVNKDDTFPAVYAVTRSGFGVSVSFRGKGQAFLEADTPCVKESKVAAPASEPNGPAYEGVYPLPRPDVRSDFWSGEGEGEGEGE
ncbi:hypothetical protein HXS80_18760 [Streptomyces sp. CB04723]|uniref:hypothetical protein n=1 Tax=Streptomyces TaxID=1883 RepID=UPI0015C477D7|nr:hypothetical protein [Streptomyces sp. CB04723]QLG33481.1 hypothetical protein HXS80_18760 [Streptomyces sp. CB04723]